MSEISFMQLKHWHLKQIIIALAVILVILESKKKIYYGCFITLCECTVKIIYNHFKTWLVLVNISSPLNMVLCSPVHIHTLLTPRARPSKLK